MLESAYGNWGSLLMRRKFFLASTSLAAMTCAMVASAQSSTEAYTYDPLGRLVKVVTTGGQNNTETQSICYDAAGNRTEYRSNQSSGAEVCTLPSSPAPSPTPTPTPIPSPSPTPTPTPTPTPGATAPVAIEDFVSGECFTTILTNVTANDIVDPSRTPLTVVAITKVGGQASVAVYSGGLVGVEFGPSGDFSLFNYTIRDASNATGSGTINVSTDQCNGVIPP